jgi:hypothetical protein
MNNAHGEQVTQLLSTQKDCYISMDRQRKKEMSMMLVDHMVLRKPRLAVGSTQPSVSWVLCKAGMCEADHPPPPSAEVMNTLSCLHSMYRDNITFTVFWSVMLCSWIDRCQCFGGNCFLHLQSETAHLCWRQRQHIPPQHWYLSAKLLGVTSHKTIILILITTIT